MGKDFAIVRNLTASKNIVSATTVEPNATATANVRIVKIVKRLVTESLRKLRRN
jgi:hypothetical protein